MASAVETVNVVEQRRVSPPPGSVPPARLTLTYFDVLWLQSPPVQQIFFYDFSGSTQDFRDSYFPLLERSLSLALTLFYPLAGRLVPLTDSYPNDHVILYSEGDSVSLTLAESRADFARLVRNQAKEAEEFHSLASPLFPLSSGDTEGKQETPLVAFQVTVFPRSGICIGFTVKHVVTDGFGGTHFLKSWASIFKAGGDVTVVKTLPVYDRALVGDLEHLKRNYLKTMKNETETPRASLSELQPEQAQLDRATRSTYVLTRTHIQKLRDQIYSTGGQSVGPRLSTFTVTCAYVWACLAKSRAMPQDRPTYFSFAVDCRPRLDPPVPESYFGNCIGSTLIEASQAELTGENGLVAASKTIRRAIRQLDKGVLEETDYSFRKWEEVGKVRALSIAGSPRFLVYEMDFGWGRPRKVEIVSIDHNEAMSLAESRDEEGGVEIGVVGPRDEMLRFTSYFEEGLPDIGKTLNVA
ncbi:anthocyanin 5-aromatic acyltransferase-like [Aristolochia californica]|uniref:anthocyanin 5-aromatic acyltransferase-like n=1 Tax=Aristolochia californica TaxID=171875 RepID=UPI0035D64398